MPSLISEKTPAGRRWRIRWREGGRGTKAKSSRRFDNKREAMDEMAALEARLASEKEIGNRILIPWQECCVRFWATKSGRYATEGKKALAKGTGDWPNTQSGTPTAMAALPLGAVRLARACLRWSWLHLGQPIDQRALKVAGTRKRAKHARAQLLPDDEVARLMDAATETSEGNGAIVHLVAVYGHRAENLVRLTCDNFKRGRITFRVKGGEEVAHPLLTETVERLAPLIKARPTGPIFINHWDNSPRRNFILICHCAKRQNPAHTKSPRSSPCGKPLLD